MAMARAFIRTPKILILDDCLSAVDPQTANRILHNIKHSMQGSTIVLISHSVSSVQWADQILIFKEGKLVEQGTHEELLAHKGPYYTLYKQQQYEA